MRRRLEAEALRDSLLAISGRLARACPERLTAHAVPDVGACCWPRGDDRSRIASAYRLLDGRPLAGGEKQRWRQCCHVLLCANEYLDVD